MLKLKHKIPRGYIYYHLSNCREEIIIDQNLRNETIKAIEGLKEVMQLKTAPDIKFNPKCPNCSMQPVCLPRETEKINSTDIQSIYGG